MHGLPASDAVTLHVDSQPWPAHGGWLLRAKIVLPPGAGEASSVASSCKLDGSRLPGYLCRNYDLREGWLSKN
jgi:hypothetical protein